MTKCSHCNKDKKDVRYYTRPSVFLKELVFYKTICLDCSKKLVKESERYWRAVSLMNRNAYRVQITVNLIFSLFIILSFILPFFIFFTNVNIADIPTQIKELGQSPGLIIAEIILFLLMFFVSLIYLITILRTIHKFGY